MGNIKDCDVRRGVIITAPDDAEINTDQMCREKLMKLQVAEAGVMQILSPKQTE